MYKKDISGNTFNTLKFLKIFFTVFGLIFFIIGICVLIQPKLKAKRCTESVTAEVIENIKVRSHYNNDNNHGTHSVTYRPVFEFEHNGQHYNIKSNTSSNPPVFEVGEKVELKINPNDPTDFYAPSDSTFTLVGLIFVGIGLIFTIIGIFMIIKFK